MRVGFAVVGLGRMGMLHARLLKSGLISGAELVGVYSRSRGKAIEASSSLGVEYYSSLDELLADKRVDAVVIATPTYTHSEIGIRAAEAGKHVFVEKPIDVDVRAAESLVSACRRAGVKLMVGYMRRFDDAYLQAQDAIRRGVIGTPRTYIGVSRDPEPPPPGWLRDPRLSGGIVLDLMSHDVDLALWLFNAKSADIVDVKASGSPAEVEGDFVEVAALIEFRGGRRALLYASRFSPYGYDVRCEVHGDRGSVFVGAQYEHSVAVARGGEVVFTGFKWFQERFRRAYIRELEHFTSAIIEDKNPVSGGEEALETLKASLMVARALSAARL